MRIELFIGDGWTPFTLEESEELAFSLSRPEEIDVEASVAKLRDLFAERIRDVYPRADVIVSPQMVGERYLCDVELSEDDYDHLDEIIAAKVEELYNPGNDAPLIVIGDIEGQLAGIIEDRPHDWRVER